MYGVFTQLAFCARSCAYRRLIFLSIAFLTVPYVQLSIHGGDRPLLIVGLGLNQECLVRVFGSTDHPEYVPDLCTHSPSLLPMDFSVSLRDWVNLDLFQISTYGNLNEQCGLKEREVVTRHRQVNLPMDHYALIFIFIYQILRPYEHSTHGQPLRAREVCIAHAQFAIHSDCDA